MNNQSNTPSTPESAGARPTAPAAAPQTSYNGKAIKPTINGIVVESLPNAMFKVRYQTPEGENAELLTYMAGKMTYNRIRVLIGDRVTVEIDPYGGKGKIVRRG